MQFVAANAKSRPGSRIPTTPPVWSAVSWPSGSEVVKGMCGVGVVACGVGLLGYRARKFGVKSFDPTHLRALMASSDFGRGLSTMRGEAVENHMGVHASTAHRVTAAGFGGYRRLLQTSRRYFGRRSGRLLQLQTITDDFKTMMWRVQNGRWHQLTPPEVVFLINCAAFLASFFLPSGMFIASPNNLAAGSLLCGLYFRDILNFGIVQMSLWFARPFFASVSIQRFLLLWYGACIFAGFTAAARGYRYSGPAAAVGSVAAYMALKYPEMRVSLFFVLPAVKIQLLMIGIMGLAIATYAMRGENTPSAGFVKGAVVGGVVAFL